jgi:hypothetical protein
MPLLAVGQPVMRPGPGIARRCPRPFDPRHEPPTVRSRALAREMMPAVMPSMFRGCPGV